MRTVLRHAHVLDTGTGEFHEADVVCEGGTVESMHGRVRRTTDWREIDLRGGYVLPGFIDCHVHVTAVSVNTSTLRELAPSYITAGAISNMGRMLDRGFTTVRDCGGADHGLARAQAEGLVRGPRLVFGGKALSQTGGHGDKRLAAVTTYDDHPFCGGSSRIADGVDAVRLAARDELRRGAQHIKVMASGGVASPADHIHSTQYSVDELRAANEEAEAAGRYVTVHAYPPAAILRALQSGVRCVEHGNLLDDSCIGLLVRNDAYLVPTLVTYWALAREGVELGLPRVSVDKVGEVLDGGLGALERAARGGVQIGFATDLLGPLQRYQNEEFRIRSEVQSPWDIVRSATSTAARLLQMEGHIGTVSPGAAADLLVYERNPLEHPERLVQGPDRVLQAGEVVVGEAR